MAWTERTGRWNGCRESFRWCFWGCSSRAELLLLLASASWGSHVPLVPSTRCWFLRLSAGGLRPRSLFGGLWMSRVCSEFSVAALLRLANSVSIEPAFSQLLAWSWKNFLFQLVFALLTWQRIFRDLEARFASSAMSFNASENALHGMLVRLLVWADYSQPEQTAESIPWQLVGLEEVCSCLVPWCSKRSLEENVVCYWESCVHLHVWMPIPVYVYSTRFSPLSWFNRGRSIYQQFLSLSLSKGLVWISFTIAHKGKGSFFIKAYSNRFLFLCGFIPMGNNTPNPVCRDSWMIWYGI